MNQAELQRRLYAVARKHAPSDRVPFAFEKRIMARIKEAGGVDIWAFWSQALWRAAAPCVALSIALGAWVWLAPGTAHNSDLSQDFENTLLAATDQDSPAEVIR